MKIFKSGSAGDLSLSRIDGVKVEMGGRTAFVPIEGGPFELRRLTMKQIKAIPTDRFAVSVIDMPELLTTGRPWRKNKQALTVLDVQRYRRIGRAGMVTRRPPTGYIRKPAAFLRPDAGGPGTYTVAVADLDDLRQRIEEMFDANCQLSRDNGGGPPPSTNLFYEPVDGGLMSGCIMKVIAGYFGNGDRCKLYGHDFKLHQFCLLVHYYFKRIGILKNEARQPFSEYVRKNVLKNEAAFTDKTFNNFAKLYEDKEAEFIDRDRHDINFDFRPSKDAKATQPLQQLLYAFQEIGFVFHNSDYFTHLRQLRKRMNEIQL